jgi:MYXO-CTERM domain-containing protein
MRRIWLIAGLGLLGLLTAIWLKRPARAQSLPECMNGIDDDGDNLIDFPADPDCTSPTDDSEFPHLDMSVPDLGGDGGGMQVDDLAGIHADAKPEEGGSTTVPPVSPGALPPRGTGCSCSLTTNRAGGPGGAVVLLLVCVVGAARRRVRRV